MFWVCMLSGAAGHTYGAGGVWQMNSETVHGSDAYERTPWHVAMHYPGCAQIARGKKLLEEYPWWRFEPHPEWVEPRSSAHTKPHAEWYDNHQKWAEMKGRAESVHYCRRTVSHFFVRLARLAGQDRGLRKRIYTIWNRGDLDVIPRILEPIEAKALPMAIGADTLEDEKDYPDTLRSMVRLHRRSRSPRRGLST